MARKLHLTPSAYHRHIFDQLEPKLAFTAGSALRPWQAKLRKKVRQLVGLDLDAPRRALQPRTLWKREHELGTIEKLTFCSEPYADALAYLCLPRNVKPPYPVFVCVQGHTTGAHVSIAVQRDDESAALQVEGDRDFGLGCLRRGVAALCIEQRSFGLRRELDQKQVSAHGCHDAAMQALMLGKTLLGERVYDVERGIDYLASRGDMDLSRLGVMGNSGGGTVSLFAAALLPRLRYAMPSCFFCTFRESLMAIYHCADNYVPGLSQWAEMADVMGLFAPRPVVLVAGKSDPIFPLPGVRRAYKHLQKIYAAGGAPDRCHLVVGPEGHRFYADLAWKPMLQELAGSAKVSKVRQRV